MGQWKLVLTSEHLENFKKGDYYCYNDVRGCKDEICLSRNQTIQIIKLEKDDDGYWKMPDISFDSNDYTLITIETFYSIWRKGEELLDDYIKDQSGGRWHLDNCIVRI